MLGRSLVSRMRARGPRLSAARRQFTQACLGCQVLQVPIFSDNYSHVVVDSKSGQVAAVDPADPDPVLRAMEAYGLDRLDALLITHKHADHSGGNVELARQFPKLKIYGSAYEECPAVTDAVRGGDSFSIGALAVNVLYTPCHTRGHVQYLVRPPDNATPLLFCGDTLFVGGCGRFFEGDAYDMLSALDAIAGLVVADPQTKVFCGHEYTISNLRFAMTIEPDNDALKRKLQWAETRREHGLSTVPSTIAEELSYNPFMRTRQPSVQKAVGLADPVAVMNELRQRKNSFK